jgi:hypothetical protein
MTDLTARARAVLDAAPKSGPAYRLAGEHEATHICEDYDVLLGPMFEEFLGEPEDRTWARDGAGVVMRLNEQHEIIRDLLAALDAARAEIAALRDASALPSCDRARRAAEEECERLRGEVERLRALGDRIADYAPHDRRCDPDGCDCYVRRLRTALGAKP